MKQITKYEAKDGREFGDAKECVEYEALIDRINNIMSKLQPPPTDDGCNFANGHGYIQHDPEIFKCVWNELLDEFGKKIRHDWIPQSKDMKAHPSYVGRLVGESSIAPFWKAWLRIENTDLKSFREFGQAFYANHPDRAEQFEIKAEGR